jgi:hypothetical protein
MTYADFNRLEKRSEDAINPGNHEPLAQSRVQTGFAAEVEWTTWLRELHVETASSLEDRRSDGERIACLECIIAALLEKNERMRQQLMQYMN